MWWSVEYNKQYASDRDHPARIFCGLNDFTRSNGFDCEEFGSDIR